MESCLADSVIREIYLKLDPPTLTDYLSDQQRIDARLEKILQVEFIEWDLELLKSLPDKIRKYGFALSVVVGLNGDRGFVLDIDGNESKKPKFLVVVDIGTTTLSGRLVPITPPGKRCETICFNSQAVYGREVTSRIIASEKRGIQVLQNQVIGDINDIISSFTDRMGISRENIYGVICSGNTVMIHFLYGLSAHNIRRSPYTAVSVEPPVINAKKLGIQIHSRGWVVPLPGIGGWVGSDITAGILYTKMSQSSVVNLLVDIGTNGEIVVGNSQWMVTCSASAGPALEGAGVECGMQAETGAIDRVYSLNGEIKFETIGDLPPRGLCGTGIIDLINELVENKIINRSGKFLSDSERYNLTPSVYINESDIENVMMAKAAIYAAIKILLKELDIGFSDIQHFFIAGSFGKHLNIKSAQGIGLLPPVPEERIKFIGNSSVKGAVMAAVDTSFLEEMRRIRSSTTYFDLMGAESYVDEFKQALFLPHTNLDDFFSRKKVDR